MERLPDNNSDNIILVPTDFSKVCDTAVLHGARLAQFFNYKLAILHIIDYDKKASLKKKTAERENLDKRLDQIRIQHEKKFGITVETMLKEGNIFTSINKAAEDPDVRLMVMGTHGKKGLQYLTGSYILKIADKSPVPVIVVQKRTFNGEYNNILIPVTHELHPEKKIAWARYFSGIFKANIHLYQHYYNDKIQNDRLSVCMDKITQNFSKDNLSFRVTRSEKESNFSSQVVSYAASNKCDLVMIIDVNHNVSSTAWYESLLFNGKQFPVMTINLAKIKKPKS